MSGPKVVRIVTREEVEAICRGLLGQLRAASREFLALAGRLGGDVPALRAAVAARDAEAAALMHAGRFLDLQKRVPQMVAFVREEGVRLEEAATLAIAERRSRRRRVVDGARSLAAALEAAGLPVGAGIRDIAARADRADGDELAKLSDRLASEARRMAAPAAGAGARRVGTELAARLGSGLEGRTLAQWMATDASAANARDMRLDALLAEAEAVCTSDEFAVVAARADGVAAEPSAELRPLLVDSLMLETSRTVARRRALRASATRLRDVDASLEAFPAERVRAVRSRISAALASDDTNLVQVAIGEATALAEAETKALAAAARRRAVLQGLAQLGYEVRESMATAWAEQGRVVVHKPGSQDYGVELGAPADAARVQVRLVGSDRQGAGRSAQRDRDHEVSWCGDFSELKAHLTRSGGEVVVERALDPGQQAVRTVPASSLGGTAGEEVRASTTVATRR